MLVYFSMSFSYNFCIKYCKFRCTLNGHKSDLSRLVDVRVHACMAPKPELGSVCRVLGYSQYLSNSFQTFAFLFLIFFCFHTMQPLTKIGLTFCACPFGLSSRCNLMCRLTTTPMFSPTLIKTVLWVLICKDGDSPPHRGLYLTPYLKDGVIHCNFNFTSVYETEKGVN